MNTLPTLAPPYLSTSEGPDWSTRPWGRPTIHQAFSQNGNESLVAIAEISYHGIRIRGIRLYKRSSGEGVVVLLPQKRFGETMDTVFYFLNTEEREQFVRDIVWVYESGLGRRRTSSGTSTGTGSGQMQVLD